MGGSKSGRKNKPTLLKLVTGNPGHRKLNESEPEPAVGEVIPPKWLDETALEKWAEVLNNCRWITPSDADTLALYCDSYSHYLKAQRLSIKTPLVKSPEGKLIKNPAWTARNEACHQMRSAGSEQGERWPHPRNQPVYWNGRAGPFLTCSPALVLRVQQIRVPITMH